MHIQMWGIPKKTVEPNLQFVGASARRLLPTLGQSPNNKRPSWFPALGQSPNMWRGLELSALRKPVDELQVVHAHSYIFASPALLATVCRVQLAALIVHTLPTRASPGFFGCQTLPDCCSSRLF